MIYYICSDPNFLAHHGVKGMKWGVRRYQNYDGTRIGAPKSDSNTRDKTAHSRSAKKKTIYGRAITNKDLKTSLSKEQQHDVNTYLSYKDEKENLEREDTIYRELGLDSNETEIFENSINSKTRESIERGKQFYDSLSDEDINAIKLDQLVFQMTGTHDVDSLGYELIFDKDGSTTKRPRRR